MLFYIIVTVVVIYFVYIAIQSWIEVNAQERIDLVESQIENEANEIHKMIANFKDKIFKLLE